MQPSVSIIIPVYNVEDYIEDCLKSVISQTYQGKIECIIVDDCTPDNSCKKIEEILSTYTGTIDFIIIHHEKNKGLSAARNTGIKHATGEWLYFLDSDDELYNHTIEHLTKMIPYNEVAPMIMGSYSIINTNNTGIFKEDKIYQTVTIDNNENIINSLIEGKWNVMAWNKLVNRSFITNNNLYFEEGIIHEDELWTFNILLHINRIIINSTLTYKYRVRNGSIMSIHNSCDSNSIFKILEYMLLKINYSNNQLLNRYFDYEYKKVPIRIFSGKKTIITNYNLYCKIVQLNYKTLNDRNDNWYKNITNKCLNKKCILNFIILYLIVGLIKKGLLK